MENEPGPYCPKCHNTSDEMVFWYRVEGSAWGTCWECDAPTPLRTHMATLKTERDEARRTLAAVCRVIQLSPKVARHIALHPPLLSAKQIKWARGVAAQLAATQELKPEKRKDDEDDERAD